VTTGTRLPATSTSSLVRARLRSRVGLAASIAAAIAVAIGLLCGLPAAAELASTASVRAGVPGPETADGWLQVQTRPADDADAQDAVARSVIERILGGDVEVETVRLGEPGTDLERVGWRITPAAEALNADRIDALARGLAAVPDALGASEAAEIGTLASGGLPGAVADVAAGVSAAAAIAQVPLVILAVLAWFAVLQLARLLGAVRGRETRVLTARGLSLRQDAALSAIEATAIVLAGSVAGVAGAAGAIAAAWGAAGLAALPETWVRTLVAAVVLGMTLVVAQLRGARAAARADSAAGRIARAASPGIAVLLVVLGAVLVWQAGQLAPGARDTWTAVITVLAPTVGIAAVALLSIILFGRVSALVARAAARREPVTPAYPARQVARRLGAFSVAVALVAVAVAGAVLAGAYDATWGAASVTSQRLVAGAPLRVALDPVTPGDVVAAAEVEGVDAAAPVLVTPVVAGDVPATLIALPPQSMPEVLFDVPGAIGPDALAAAVAGDRLAVEVPGDATGIGFEASVWGADPAAAAAMAVRAWLDDGSGTPIALALEVTADEAEGAVRISAETDLPTGTAPWRLVAVEVAQGRAFPGAELVVTDMAVSAIGGGGASPLAEPVPNTRLHGGAPGAPPVRSAIVWAAAGDAAPRVPAVVTTAFAEPLGLGLGDEVDVRFDGTGRTIPITVAGVTPALPGTGSGGGVLVSLDAMADAAASTSGAPGAGVATLPVANRVWAAGDDAAGASLGEALGAPVATVGSVATALAGEVVMLWDAAAIGGALLAGVALVALFAALTSQRTGEVLVLRALGIPPRAQARMRSVEMLLVVLLAVVLGAVGGVALAALLVPHMAERAIPDAQLPPQLAFAPWPVVVALAVLGLALVAATLGALAAVRRQATSTRIEEAAP